MTLLLLFNPKQYDLSIALDKAPGGEEFKRRRKNKIEIADTPLPEIAALEVEKEIVPKPFDFTGLTAKESLESKRIFLAIAQKNARMGYEKMQRERLEKEEMEEIQEIAIMLSLFDS